MRVRFLPWLGAALRIMYDLRAIGFQVPERDIDALIEYLRSLPKVRYKLGIGTPGGIRLAFLRYVDTLEEAEKWASTPAECKGTTNVYEEVGGEGTKE